MALKTNVKISNISNLSDARYCAGMGVDMLGFCVDESKPDYINPTTFSELTQWVAGPLFVGEFGSMNADDIKLINTDYQFDLIEATTIESLEPLAVLDKPLILKLENLNDHSKDQIIQILKYAEGLVKHIVFQFDYSNLETINQSLSQLSGIDAIMSITPATATIKALEASNFQGIELQASPEEKTGLKDYGEVMDVLEELEVD